MKRFYSLNFALTLLVLLGWSVALEAQPTTFNFTGAMQTYTVPSGVTLLALDVVGAQGGNATSNGSQGGRGGRATAALTVTPGQVLNVFVGGKGVDGNSSTSVNKAGGYNGGGTGRGFGGGGGGASDIRIGGTALTDRRIVAAGGGGGGYNCGSSSEHGGAGGGLTGSTGWECGAPSPNYAGSGATQTAGGASAAFYGRPAGTFGTGASNTSTSYCGGGGGGWYGGGCGEYGGGGGGSSYIAGSGLSTAVTTADFRTGDGYIIITPALPTVTPSPSSLSFGAVGTSTTSSPLVFSYSGIYMTDNGTMTITAPSNFQVSSDGVSWGSSFTYTYTGNNFSGVLVYVRFQPTAITSYSGNITISGGGLSSAVNVAVSGSGASACSGTPSAGSITINGGSSASGNSSTTFTLNGTGQTAAGGIALQWQIGTSSTGPWSDIAGATSIPFTYSGLPGNRWFRLSISCGASTSTSSTVSATFTMPGSSCIPTSLFSPCSYFVGNSSNPVIINGALSTVISDASNCGSGTGGSSFYYNNIGQSVTMFRGSSYTSTIGSTQSYTSVQVWIDFNDNGVFDNATETVGGYLDIVGASGVRRNPVLSVPSTATLGAHRMRVMSVYSGGYGPGANLNYPAFPLLNPCPTTTVYYADTRDYTVIISEPPAVVTTAPSSVNFGNVTVGTSSLPVAFSRLTGSNFIPLIGFLTVTAPSGFQVSSNGSSWGTTASIGYSGGSFSATNIYIRYSPTATGSASGNVTITGGGLSAAVNIAVSGNGVSTSCSGTPTAGTASISPSSGNSTTVFNLSLSGASATGGLFYQWQISTNGGSTWTNIPEGIMPTLSYTGLSTSSQFRCLVSCGTGASATSGTASATFSSAAMAASSCTPTFSSASASCTSFSMWMRISSLTGAAGSIADATACNSTGYSNLTASFICTLNAATTYTAQVNTGPSYFNQMGCQIWIDFNNNGVFDNATETVGGLGYVFTSTTMPVTLTIPNGAPTGLYRMRIVGNYNCCGNGTFPNMNPCPTTAITYGEVRDYSVYINGGAAPCSGTPLSGIVNAGPSQGCTSFTSRLFNVGGTTNPGITWTWQQSTTSATAGFSSISGATSATYTTPTISTPGTIFYRAIVSCGTNSVTTTATSVQMASQPDISSFAVSSATNACSGAGSTVTVNSSTLGTGTFTVTYSLSGANTSSGNTATMTMSSSSGTFSIPSSLLTSAGAMSVTVTGVTSGFCTSNPSTGNTSAFVVGSLPNLSNFTSPSATNVCAFVSSTATVNSNTLGAGTYTVTFTLSGANTASAQTAELTMGASNGTFTIPSSLLTTAGSTTLTINSIMNSTGCVASPSSSNTTSFTVSASAAAFSMTGGGSYCIGGTGVVVGISTSTTGNNYQLYRGATMVGSAVSGTGSAISFGLQTTAGTYTVLATNSGSGCTRNGDGTATVNITPPPSVYSVSGGGSYCTGGSGVNISLTNSDASIAYQLYNGGSPVGGPVFGVGGAPISLGTQTLAGTYIVVANPGTSCASTMSGSANVVINPLPTAYAVTGGGNYCAGGSGANVCLGFGSTGIQYSLYNGSALVSTVGGSNSSLCFGAQTAVGTYSVQAVNTATGCVNGMSGTVTIGTVPSPSAQTVTGGGAYCSGGTGVAVGLGSSQTGASYQLFNSTTGSAMGAAVTGTGGAVSFGNQTAAGVYTVMATITTGTISCTSNMSGSATVIQNATPPVFTVTGGGGYCAGNAGSSVGLAGSTAGVNYQLYSGATLVGTPVAGTGAAISFGTYTAAGTYSVLATNATTGCTAAMSGTAVISINALPTVFSVGGGGSYCVGGSGFTVTLSGSQTGINYTCFLNGSTVIGILPGTGGSLSFGTQTNAGVYTIVAVNATTGCTSTMSGSATIVVNPLPIVYPVTGGGNYCSGSTGVAIGLAGSQTGVSYTLYNGATAIGTAVAGTGSPISLGVQTMSGTFTVFANNTSTSCTNTMSGTATIGINPLPSVFAVTGSGSYCAGGTGLPVGLSSSTAGVNYSLFNGSTVVAVTGGTGGPITFGTYTAAGTYTVSANNTSTGCNNNMTGSAVLSINALPTAQTMSSSSSSYCAGSTGVTLGLTSSQSSVNYMLYNGSTLMGTISGTGAPISFGVYTAAGTYSVVAVNSTTSCQRNMTSTASISINALPTTYGVTGGGNYCSGGAGVSVGLTGSQSGISYQLYNGAAAVGSPVSGTGAAISFGSYTAAGTYSVLATNGSTGCTSNMTGVATVGINNLPNVQTVSGGGIYCAGTGGVSVGLGNSQVGVNYQLYNGSSMVGTAVAGTGSSISFGNQTNNGTYVVVATNVTTGCVRNMSGSAIISTNAAPTVFTVTGGGNYCADGSGVSITLSGSQSGVNYQLYNGTLAVGSPVAGTGAAIDMGTHTGTGSYNVVAMNASTGCMSNMSGSASIGINPLPNAYTVTGGGSYCNGSTGVNVGLNGSTPGITYQLYVGGIPSGTAIGGTGLAIDFGIKTAPGSYTVIAYNPATGCLNTMNGSAAITVNSLPVIQTVIGGGSYCSGGSGVSIGLENSVPGTSYQLYNGTAAAGAAVLGTGDAISFGSSITTAGTYSVLATNVGSGCSRGMSGSAVVSISNLPNVQTVSGGGTICAGGTGAMIYLSNSQGGVNYQLYNGGAPVGGPIGGTGSAINFGAQTNGGVYTVQATNASTGCVRNMNGTAVINVNPQPAAQIVTGGGNYCTGESGVSVGLGSSNSGVNYQLYYGSTAVGAPVSGTGAPLSFGLQTGVGNYSVVATTAATGCSRSMTGTVSVGINALPTAYTVSGGGSYCAGGTGVSIQLNNSSTSASYQLMNGSTAVGTSVSGTGGPLSFAGVTEGGTYYVVATNTLNSCSRYMNGSAAVVVNAVPVSYAVTGGGDYCADGSGVAIGVSASNSGISYQLYNGAATVGSAVAGNGGAISFGNQMTAGTYSVLGTNTSTGCTSAMGGSATVNVNALPSNYTVSGGGSLCTGAAGVAVSLSGSDGDATYQLMNGSTAVGAALTGSGSGLSFGPQETAGNYMVVATNTAGCSRTMSGSATVIVNALPIAQTVTGGGNYCAGGAGVSIGLSSSQSGISYQLNDGTSHIGTSVAGTGGAISFGNQTIAGNYIVVATNSTTGCTNTMSGSATVNVNALPSSYAVLSTGSSYCAGAAGVHVLLSGSDNTASYQLYVNGVSTGASVAGSGGSIDFGAQTAPGIYTVIADNAMSGCSRTMSGSASIIINALPTQYTVTGSGGYCNGGAGVEVGLSGSGTGISYQLMNGSTAVGAAVSGTGGAISFGTHAAGNYMVVATNTFTSCSRNMSGSAVVSVNASPAVYAVSGGGSYCSGSTGVAIGLSGSATGMSYQLYNGTGAVGAAVAGSGSAISFGNQTLAGNYTVRAMNTSTGCSAEMSGSATVSINSIPVAHPVTGGGNYCAGGTGVSIGLGSSSTGVNYQLYRGGSPVSGALLSGTGSSLSFGTQTASGSYVVMATSTSNGCTNMMGGSVSITVNEAPSAYAVTGSGNYCATSGASGLAVGLSGSQSGVNYQLYNSTGAVGAVVAGTGGAISFGNQLGGDYTVIGTNASSGCSADMSGAANVVANAAVSPAVSVSSSEGNTVCMGTLTTFTASAVNGGAAPAYQWKVNGVPVGLGFGSYAYVPANGDVVSVEMTSSAACASPSMASASTVMTVNSLQTPVVTVVANPGTTVCAGTNVTLTATSMYGGSAASYKWYVNGSVAGLGSSYAYTPSNNDEVRVEMTSNYACRLADMASDAVTMKVEQAVAPVVNITANPGTSIAQGQTVTLVANATGAVAPTYQWYVNSAAIAGATNVSYTSSNFANNDEVMVEVTNNGACLSMSGAKTVVMKVSTVGVQAVAGGSDVRLMPNPNKGDFFVKGTLNVASDKDVQVEVTNMLGQVVYSGVAEVRSGSVDAHIQLSNTLANGMYILTLHGDHAKHVIHFVMQQ